MYIQVLSNCIKYFSISSSIHNFASNTKDCPRHDTIRLAFDTITGIGTMTQCILNCIQYGRNLYKILILGTWLFIACFCPIYERYISTSIYMKGFVWQPKSVIKEEDIQIYTFWFWHNPLITEFRQKYYPFRD